MHANPLLGLTHKDAGIGSSSIFIHNMICLTLPYWDCRWNSADSKKKKHSSTAPMADLANYTSWNIKQNGTAKTLMRWWLLETTQERLNNKRNAAHSWVHIQSGLLIWSLLPSGFPQGALILKVGQGRCSLIKTLPVTNSPKPPPPSPLRAQELTVTGTLLCFGGYFVFRLQSQSWVWIPGFCQCTHEMGSCLLAWHHLPYF